MTLRSVIVFIGLTLAPVGLAAPSPADPVAPASGTVLFDADHKPIASKKATIKGSDGKLIDIQTDEAGKFAGALPIGAYSVSVGGDGPQTPATIVTPGELVISAANKAEAPVPPAAEERKVPAPAPAETGWGIRMWAGVLLAIYWGIVLVARFHNILKVNQALLRAAISAARQEIAATADQAIAGRALALVDLAQSAAPDDGSVADRNLSFLFGMRGQIAAAWVQLNEAHRILAASYTRDQVVSSLRVIVEQLRPEYSKIADKIDAVLQKSDTPGGVTDDFLKATLSDGLKCANEKKEGSISDTLNWQNKAFTLIFAGACLLFAMAALLPNPMLLFVGFAGGFASRLMRGKSEDSAKPVDADLTWTNLFLSPIYGAFTGWAGILLLIVLTDLKVTGEVFKELKWETASTTTIGLGLAFLFGFSERYFSAVTDLAEKTIIKGQNTKAADPQGPPNSPAVAAGAGIPPQAPPPPPPKQP
jgi:hypothetical protein